ncbi:MAG: hypothetical protein GY791_13680 [Alphaproteobacteria bacterium]|nr:hypothetical protein [Alphaproteobacteria bacterium]
MTWRIVLRHGGPDAAADIPAAVLTIGPRFRQEGMPEEVSILLPTNAGPKRLIDAVAEGSAPVDGAILGLFLASPFLNVESEGRRLAQAGVRWVTNLPSVAQQDEEFARQLSDVDLDHRRELQSLAAVRDQGFRIAPVVADGADAVAAVDIAPDALIVLPRVADFAAGFPSLRQRGAAIQAVANAVAAAGWPGPVFGLGNTGEAEHERLWPERLDGMICRPVPV